MRWYVAMTESGKEVRVAERFIALGYEPWTHDLLTGYAFARFSGPTEPMRYTKDVLRLLPTSVRPQPIDDDLMLVMQEQCRAFEEAIRPITRAEQRYLNTPIAGIARKNLAHLLSAWANRVTIGSNRVELDEHPPRSSAPRGARRNHGHDARRAIKLAAGA